MRTQMMKGLFNYKTAYVEYTRACLADFARDNIQYAEIRPNFMSTNQVWEDDGSGQLNNEAIMKLIISGYEDFQRGHQRKVLMGLKVIYCTPRSFGKPKIAEALKECLKFKKNFPNFIAGKRTIYMSLDGMKVLIHAFQDLISLAKRATRSLTLWSILPRSFCSSRQTVGLPEKTSRFYSTAAKRKKMAPRPTRTSSMRC